MLIEAGVIPQDELESYGSDDSRLPMSGMASDTPGMENSGGSLGQGLPMAVGMALALRRKKSDCFVYNLMSDGDRKDSSPAFGRSRTSVPPTRPSGHPRRRGKPVVLKDHTPHDPLSEAFRSACIQAGIPEKQMAGDRGPHWNRTAQ